MTVLKYNFYGSLAVLDTICKSEFVRKTVKGAQL